MSRARSQTDAQSGITLDVGYFVGYNEDEIREQFDTFKSYDIDNTGFVSKDNLKSVLDTMEVNIGMEQIIDMIEEVAILCNHPNDGSLSFRDFMKCMEYEKKKEQHNDAVAAAEELAELGINAAERDQLCDQTSVRKEEDAAEEEEEPIVPGERMRGTSFAVLNNIAASRIKAFTQEQEEKEAAEPVKKEADPSKANEIAARIAKFKRPDVASVATSAFEAQKQKNTGLLPLKDENLWKATLKNKLAAFEAAKKAADNDQPSFKKSWRNQGHQQWKGKRTVVGADGSVGPPPKVDLQALLKK
jgi:hypothetical protein